MTRVIENTSNTTKPLLQALSQKPKISLCIKIWIVVSVIICVLIVIVSCLSLALITPAWSPLIVLGALLIPLIIIKILSGKTKNLETTDLPPSYKKSPTTSEVRQTPAEQASNPANESTNKTTLESRPPSPITQMERLIEKISLKSSEGSETKKIDMSLVADSKFKIIKE